MGHHAFAVDEANEMLPEVRAALNRIHSLRDVARSCWQSDEPKVAFWHEVSGGYVGRRRITAGRYAAVGSVG